MSDSTIALVSALVSAVVSLAVAFFTARFESKRELKRWERERELSDEQKFEAMSAAVSRLFVAPVAEDRRAALAAIEVVRTSADGELYELLGELSKAVNQTDTEALRAALDSASKCHYKRVHEKDPKKRNPKNL